MMKKLLFLAVLAMTLGFTAQAQMRILVELPGGGPREIVVESKPTADGSWGFGDIDTMHIRTGPAQCLVAPDDSIGCNTTFSTNLTGKIAIIHRGSPASAPGTCQFGCKAERAEQAGAIAVILINNAPGSINMGAADCGGRVNIPVVMISQADGRELKSLLCSGPIVNVGTYRNVYANNIGIDRATGAVSPPAAAMPVTFVNATGMFRFTPNIFVDNNGFADQANVKATAVIKMIYSPSQTYPQTVYSDSAIIPLIQRADQPADTAEVNFDEFDLFTAVSGDRQGIYELTYVVESPNGDQLMSDNMVRYTFRITDKYYSLAPLNPQTNDLERFNGISPVLTTATNRVYKFGPVMQTPTLQSGQILRMDSVRLAVTAGDTVDFTALQINIEVHKWVDADDNGAIAETELTQIGNGLMAFQDISERGKFMSVGIDDAVTGDPGPIPLESNTTYLIMAAYRGDDIVSFSSEDELFPYDRFFDTQATRVINPLFMNSWFSGFTSNSVGAYRIGIDGLVAAKPSVNQIAVSIFPNPAREYVQVQLDEKLIAGTQLDVCDMSGRKLRVSTTTTAGGIRVNTRTLESGVYQMSIRTAKGVAVKKFTVRH